MPGFIEELYYGNLDPQSLYEKSKKRERTALKKLSELEEELIKVLEGEEKEKFLAFVETANDYAGKVELDAFETGFRLGAQFAYDSFVFEP